MNKKRNLLLLGFLLGVATNLINKPVLKLAIFAGLTAYLFLTFDEWEYKERVGK